MAASQHPLSRHFADAQASVLTMPWRSELVVEEIPAPQRIAPFAVAVAADIVDAEGGGRLIVLHDPEGNPAWDGDFRCVTYARAEVDPEMGRDPMLAEVGWMWLTDALERHGAEYGEPSGTVTVVSSTPFGSMSEEPARVEVEIRASWTPRLRTGAEMAVHAEAWQELLCMVAGLPTLPQGVVSLSRQRIGRRLS